MLSLTDRLSATFSRLGRSGRLSEADVTSAVAEIRRALLDADVALPVVRTFTAQVRQRALQVPASAALNPTQQVVKIVYEELVDLLGSDTAGMPFASGRPTVVMLVGLQGAGKTSLAGKLAYRFAAEGRPTMLVAADLARPNAVDQLRVVAAGAGAAFHGPFPGSGVGDPVAAAVSGVAAAKAAGAGVVIVDTAGRLAVDSEAMGQAGAIAAAITPDVVLLAVDAMTGQDAANTAVAFNEVLDVDGVVLTKADGDSRGGAVLSVRALTGVPIMFSAVGEKVADLEVFHPDRMASRILDMGDMLTLIEAAEAAAQESSADEMVARLAAGGQFTLNDFADQLATVQRMGSLSKVASLLPGAAKLRAAAAGVDDSVLVRARAIISSMTPAERADPSLLNGSRRARVARGAGVHVSEVNMLLTQFGQAANMLRRAAVEHRDRPARSAVRRKKSSRGRQGRSGNPAKRAAQEAAAAADGG